MFKRKLGFDGYVRDADGAMIARNPGDPNWLAAEEWAAAGDAPEVIIDPPFCFQRPGPEGYPVVVTVPGVSMGDVLYAILTELSAPDTAEFADVVGRTLWACEGSG